MGRRGGSHREHLGPPTSAWSVIACDSVSVDIKRRGLTDRECFERCFAEAITKSLILYEMTVGLPQPEELMGYTVI